MKIQSTSLYNADSDSDHEISYKKFTKIKLKSCAQDLIETNSIYASSSLLTNISQSILEATYAQYNELKQAMHNEIVSKVEDGYYPDKFIGWKKYIPGLHIFDKKTKNQQEVSKHLSEYFDKYSSEISEYFRNEWTKIHNLRNDHSERNKKHSNNIQQFLESGGKDSELDPDIIQILGFNDMDELKTALLKRMSIKYFTKNATLEEIKEIVFGSQIEVDKSKLKALELFKNLLSDKKIKSVEIIQIILNSRFIDEFYHESVSEAINNDIDNLLDPIIKKLKPNLIQDETSLSDQQDAKLKYLNFSKEKLRNYIKADGEYIGVHSVKLILENEEDNINK